MRASPQVRIAILSPWGAGGGYSGPLILMDRLFKELKNALGARIHLTLIARDRGDERRPGWADEFVPIRVGAGAFAPRQQLRWALAARRELGRRRHRVDLVHLHGVYLANQLTVFASRTQRITVLLPVLAHGDLQIARSGAAGLLKRRITRTVVGRASAGLALTPTIAEEFRTLGMPERRVVEIGNAADVSRYRGVRSLPDAELRVGFVGKLGPIKQPHLIVHALGELRRRGRKTTAVFVGPFADARYEQRFHETIRNEGVEDAVQVTGFIEDPTPFLNDSIDVFVLPSSSEGLPGALVEALAAALPAVVTNVGGMADAIGHGEAGAVVEAEASDIADAITRVTADPSTYSRISSAARRIAEHRYSSTLVAQKYIAALRAFDRPALLSDDPHDVAERAVSASDATTRTEGV